MAVNVEAMRHLAKSVLSCALLAVCSQGGSFVMGSVHGVTNAVRWASVVVLLSSVYYLQFQVCLKCWQRKRERRHRRTRSGSRSQYSQASTAASVDTASVGSAMEDVDLDTLPQADEVWVEGASVVSNAVYYPELTMSSVWTYVYGWGVLLFVCVYCLAGLDVPSSCWWVMGMVALSFDELISKGVGKWMVCFIGLGLCGSIFSVWSGALMDDEGNFIGDLMFSNKSNIPLLNFIMGVALPVSTPFIFFSIRSTVRSATQDVTRLCEFALPFMTVLAGCCLVATSGMCDVSDEVFDKGRRGMLDYSDSNTTAVMVETVAKFAGSYASNLDKHSIPLNSKTLEYFLVFIAPVFAFWLVRVLVVSILTRHATEFIVAFVLVTSARFGMTHPMGVWSVMSVSGAGFAFVLLLFDVR